MTPRSEMIVAAVSDDGSQVVLISSDSDPKQYHTFPTSPDRDAMQHGRRLREGGTSPQPDVTQAASHNYKGDIQPVLMHFLPDNRLFVYRQFGTVETSNKTTTVYRGVQDTSIYAVRQRQAQTVDGLPRPGRQRGGGRGGSRGDPPGRSLVDGRPGRWSQETITPVVWSRARCSPSNVNRSPSMQAPLVKCC